MTPTGSTPAAGASLEAVCDSQRTTRQVLGLVLVGGILLATGVDIVLLRQVGMLRRQAEQVGQFVSDYQRNELPVINRFVADLQAFARTNADFRPVLNRYIAPEEGPKLNPPPAVPKGF